MLVPDDSVDSLEPEGGAGQDVMDVADDFPPADVSGVTDVVERLGHVQLVHQFVPSDGFSR